MSSRVPLETPVVAKEIPDVITDPSTKRTYERGKFLGKVKEKDILTCIIARLFNFKNIVEDLGKK